MAATTVFVHADFKNLILLIRGRVFLRGFAFFAALREKIPGQSGHAVVA